MTLPTRIETLLGPLFVAIFAIALSLPCLCASAEASQRSAQRAEASCACAHGDTSGDAEEKGCCCGCDMAEQAPDAPVVADTQGAITASDLRPQLAGAPLLVELPEHGQPALLLAANPPFINISPPGRSAPWSAHAASAAPTYLRVLTLRL